MSSSKSQKFTESELKDINLWTNLTEFGSGHAHSEELQEAPRTLTVEEIEAMQQQAYDEAFNMGKQEGFEQGKEQGFEEGKAQGLEEGYKQGYEDTVHLLQKRATELALLMETLREPFQKLDEAIEQELVQLVIAIASQVIRREIEINPQYIVEIIKESLKLLPSANQQVTLTLHPEDAELVRSMLKFDENLPDWRLEENAAYSRGGCTVDTEQSHLDATLDARLAEVISRVLNGENRAESEL